MKLSVAFAALAALGATSPAMANGFTNSITDTVNLQVQGAAVQMERIGSNYAVSGSNVTMTPGASGMGLDGGTATTSATAGSATYAPTVAGQAFSFSESLTIGDSVGTAATAGTLGVIDSPANYGKYTTQFAGSATGNSSTMAGTLSPTGIPTITAGGVGTTATAQRSITLSVFD